MGSGKMMVEFFSVEMVVRVCRYLHTLLLVVFA
jgi:hypothetical protein